MDDVLYLSESICIGLGKNNLSRAGGSGIFAAERCSRTFLENAAQFAIESWVEFLFFCIFYTATAVSHLIERRPFPSTECCVRLGCFLLFALLSFMGSRSI